MSDILFGSVCSGIEAASVAFGPLGWEAAWFAEIEGFPAALLAHRYPHVKNLGDMTLIARAVLEGSVLAPEVLVGGTPCQAFSVAGLRESLSDARGGLTLKFVELANAIDHVRTRRGEGECVIKWENVPGVLSTKDNAFGCFLGALVGESEPLIPAGGKWTDAGCVYGPQRAAAWRVLDAQYFGLAQRRRRVFVVASAREGFDPAEVLFERDGVRRDFAPGRQAGQDPTGTLDAGIGRRRGSGMNPNQIAGTLLANGKAAGSATQQDAECGLLVAQAFGGNKTSGPRSVASALSPLSAHGGSGRMDFETETFVARTLRAEGFDASEDGTGRGTPLVPVPHVDVMPTMRAGGTNASASHGQVSGDTRDEYLVPVSCLPIPIQECMVSRANLKGTGTGIGKSGDPMFTLQAAQPHGIVAFDTTQITSAANFSNPKPGDPCHPLAAGAHPPAIAFDSRQDLVSSETVFGALCSSTPQAQAVAMPASRVRRLTPRECERLQGFPDDYTLIPDSKRNWTAEREEMRAYFERTGQCFTDDELDRLAADGPRYKALGNSWAVPCVRWIGQRIDAQLRRSA